MPLILADVQRVLTKAANNFLANPQVQGDFRIDLSVNQQVNIVNSRADNNQWDYGIPYRYELPRGQINGLTNWWIGQYPHSGQVLPPQFKHDHYVINIQFRTNSGRLFNMHVAVTDPAFAQPRSGGSLQSVKQPTKTNLNLSATPIMSQAYALGQGFNIYDQFDLNSLIKPLVDFNKVGTQTFTFLGKDYLIPSIITPVENTNAYYNGGTFESREGFQNKLAVHAGVSATYGAFSGEMQADYASEFTQNVEYVYAFNNFYSQLAYLELNEGSPYLSSDFVNRLNQLPTTVSTQNLSLFADFFNDFGVYYTQRITLGGSMDFYVAVAKSSQLSTTDVSALLNAQYEGLVTKGSIDASVKSSQAWQSYAKNSRTEIHANGGEPVKVAALTGIDPLNPSPDTVEKYKEWVASIQNDPAIVDFQLAGVWQLCGDKRQVVQEAWEIYGAQMHPRLTIETTSSVVNWPNLPTAKPPVIILGGNQIQPDYVPDTPCGYQLVIIDGTNILDPDNLLFCRYYSLAKEDEWLNTYQAMYSAMLEDIQEIDGNATNNLLILSSFGLDNNMPPPPDFYSLLRSAGAGTQLQYWETHSDPGSEVGNPSAWVSYPANYIFVGFFGNGPDTGVELYTTTSSAQLEVFFYRQTYTGQYTLGIGD